MNRQLGFTMIELVVVIVILSILAATALPRFINVSTDARIAAVNGIAGGLRAGVALAQAKYFVVANNALTTVDMNGTSVAVAAVTGIPTGAAGGIGLAVDVQGATAVYGATSTFTPSGGSATCQATYVAATGLVAAPTGGC